MATTIRRPIGAGRIGRASTAPHAGLIGAGVLAMAIAVFLAVPYVAMRVGLGAQDLLSNFDPDRAFVYLYAHHAVEAALGLAAIALLAPAALRWVKSLGDVRTAVRTVAVFGGLIAVFAILFNDLPVFFGAPPVEVGYPLVPRNVAGVLLFQLIVVGLGEEILFRGAILGILRRAFGHKVRIVFFDVSVAGLITAALFALAHTIYYDLAFWPITLSANWLQVGYSFGLGVYYAALTERTGSIWGAVVSHNISDVLYVLALWLAVGAA